MKPVKNLLVDLDGTLLGNRNLSLSLQFVKKAVQALKPLGGTGHALSTLLAIQKELHRESGDRTNDVRVVDLFARKMNLTPEKAREIIREKLFIIFPELKKYFFPVPGALEFLEWARNKHTLILATNPVWPPEIQELRVKWAGIDPTWFKSITHIRKMNACKPSPKYFAQILEQEGFSPDDTLHIGDELKMDLPATKVGIRVFLVGPYKKISPVKLKGAKAEAWRGSYQHLRQFLESGIT